MEQKILLHIRGYFQVSLLELTEENRIQLLLYLDDDRYMICNHRLILPKKNKRVECGEVEIILTRRSRNFERNSKSSSHLSSFLGIFGVGKYSSRKINSIEIYKIIIRLFLPNSCAVGNVRVFILIGEPT